MGKKLYKSNKNKMLDGVCGGIAEYFNIDPTLVRLGWVVFCALGGSGVLAYIVKKNVSLQVFPKTAAPPAMPEGRWIQLSHRQGLPDRRFCSAAAKRPSSAPMRAPASTSDGKCTNRYSREKASAAARGMAA